MESRTLKYIDTCTPDYFQGFDGHVYAIPLSKGDTYRDVFKYLKNLINSEEIHDFEGNYAAIVNECEGMRFVAKEQGYIDAIFNKYIEDDDSETCYAYFGF